MTDERPGPEHAGSVIWKHALARYGLASSAVSGKRVLDLACANGFGTVILAEHAQSVIGADVSKEAIEGAQQLNPRPNVRYQLIDRPPFPFPPQSFDVIVSLETIEHMPREAQSAFIAEFERLLAPDGALMLSAPDAATERAQATILGEYNPWHIHTPTSDEVSTYLRKFTASLELLELDLVLTAFIPATMRDALHTSSLELAFHDQPAPISRIWIGARSQDGLRAFDISNAPLVFRHEPRLGPAEEALAAQATRIRARPDLAADVEVRPSARERWPNELASALARRLALGTRSIELLPNGRLAAEDHTIDFILGVQIARLSEAAAAEASRVLTAKGIAFFAAGSATARTAAASGLVHQVEFEEVDLVATTIMSERMLRGEEAIGERKIISDVDRTAVGSARILVASADPELIRAISSLPPVAFVRGDFQRRAFWSQLLSLPRLPDLSGLPLPDRVAFLGDRAAYLENRVLELTQRVDHLTAQLKKQHPKSIVQRWLGRGKPRGV